MVVGTLIAVDCHLEDETHPKKQFQLLMHAVVVGPCMTDNRRAVSFW